MFKASLRLLVLVCMLVGITASGASRNRNGGGIWACQKTEHGIPTSAMLVDFFEAKEQYDWSFKRAPRRATAVEFARQIGAGLSNEFPDRYVEQWQDAIEEVIAKMNIIDGELEIIPDSYYAFRPPPQTCDGRWTYVQFAIYSERDEVLIRKDLWNSALLTLEEKAGLLWHEAIYLWLRNYHGDEDSVRARFITGLVFAVLDPQTKQEQLAKIMQGQTHGDDTWICRMQNGLSEQVFGAYGAIELEAEAFVQQACRNGGMEFHCEDQEVTCEKLESDTLKWSCVAKNDVYEDLFVARGRNRIEAEFKSQELCQKSVLGSSYHQCMVEVPECSSIQ